MPPVDSLHARNLEEELRLIQNLDILLIGGSVDGGARIVVSAVQSMPLIDVLSQIPIVEQVTKKGKDIQISLKSGAIAIPIPM